jgi:hypothetical protein
MNGGRPKFIYQDSRCLFDDLSSSIPMCSLITPEELKQAGLTEDGLTNICKKNISNAFENVPFGDLKYGLLGSVPAEIIHVSGTGLLKHMVGYLDNLIGGPNLKKKVRNHLRENSRNLHVINLWPVKYHTEKKCCANPTPGTLAVKIYMSKRDYPKSTRFYFVAV